MKDIRISRLILNLNTDELDFLENYFSNNKQKLYLSILESILQLKKKDLTREEIYLRIYKKKYTLKNDVQFRNQLSDLADTIEDILIKNKLQEKYKNDIQFQLKEKLDFYFQHNFLKEYEAILKEVKIFAVENFEYGFYAKSLYQFSLLMRKNIQQLKDTASKMHDVVEEMKQFNLMQFDLDKGKVQASHGFAIYCNFQCGNLKKISENDIEVFEENIENATTDVGKYWNLNGICFLVFQTDINSLHYFESMVDVARKIFKTYLNFKETLISTLQLLATKYSLIGSFEKANEYFQEIFSIVSNDKHPQLSVIYLNYITNLTKLEKYQEALEKITFVEENLVLNELYTNQLFMRKIMCYTFLEQPALLHKAILGRDYAALNAAYRIYFRLSVCNAYIMEHNYELADTEIKNLLRSKLMNEADTDHLPNAELMQYLIAQVYKNNNLKLTQEQIAKFRKLQSQLNIEQYPFLQHYTPYLWLIGKLKL